VLRRCPDHGYFEGGGDAGGGGDADAADATADGCPDCGRAGEAVLSSERRTRLSKFTSGALRHLPEDVGIAPTAGGGRRGTLVAAAGDRYPWADETALAAVIATDPKGRFERDGERIRATCGHSIDVDLEPTDAPVPDVPYHGTPRRDAEAIREEGLQPMGRQTVHRSETPATAREVGRRHGDIPVVFAVDAAELLGDGHRVTRRGRETYTAGPAGASRGRRRRRPIAPGRAKSHPSGG